MKIMVSAGEVSGDVHGSYLVKELKKINPNIHFFGMGSERLAAEGVDIKFDISKRGTIGIFEALPNVIPIYLTFLKMKQLALKEKPDLVLLVDSQGFNLPFARFCKKAGIKTVYYIAPQPWLWGTAKGVKQVAETVDLIVAVFQQEYEAYQRAGANVVYYGHPLVDIVKSSKGPEAGSRRPVISICPGSRTQEIKGVFPLLLKAAELIKKEVPDAEFLMPVPSTRTIEEMFDLIGAFHPRAITGQTYDILAASDLAICTSGTINLEASLLGTPNIMVYKLSPFTYFVGKYILKIDKKIKYFSMPNILLGEKVIPELVMGDARPDRIAAEALSILKDPRRQTGMKASFVKLREKLGKEGVIQKIAEVCYHISMNDLGSRVDFHCHSIFSDGMLLPAALIREAEVRGHSALAITDHVDASNIEEVIKILAHFEKEMQGKLPIKFIPGAEISYIKPEYIAEYCRKARKLGAKLIVVHGESPVEPVYPGTNHAAVKEKGLVDVLAHPGNITEEDVILAAKNEVYLELTARRGHRDGNRHVAEMAGRYGAKLLVNTDCHNESDLITQEQAFQICKEAGLTDEEAIKTIKDNPQELLKRIERR